MRFKVVYKNKQDLVGNSSQEAKLVDITCMCIRQLKVVMTYECTWLMRKG
jgi:hypothetical protein